MGLLDDAIRDHLELKRLRGADPGEVAREQMEALDPVFGDEDAAHEQDVPSVEEDLDRPANRGETAPVGAPPVEAPHTTPKPAPSMELSNVSEETAEFDMQTVLDKHPDAPVEHYAPEHEAPEGHAIDGSTDGSHPAENRDEDPLEWEVPGESSGKIQ